MTIDENGVPNTITIDLVTPVPTNREAEDSPKDEGDHKEKYDTTHEETEQVETPMNIKIGQPPRQKLDQEKLCAHASTLI